MKRYLLVFRCNNWSNEYSNDNIQLIKKTRKIKKIVDEIFTKMVEFEEEGLFFLNSFVINQETSQSEFGFQYDFFIQLEELTTKIKHKIENYIENKTKELILKEKEVKGSFRIVDKPLSQEIDISIMKFGVEKI